MVSQTLQADTVLFKQLKHICDERNIDVGIFTPGNRHLNDTLEEHTAWAFNNIYSIPYEKNKKSLIARTYHGIEHVGRATYYTSVFVNLYKMYNQLTDLTAEDLRLLQLAALFHDSGRRAEGVDLWDKESAVLLYAYLRFVLQVPETKSTLIAEAVANKDAGPDNYEELVVTETTLTWKKTENSHPRNSFQKIIHDVDCLDIIRARSHFDASHLDFYKDIASYPEYSLAFESMAQLICEARSIITTQGDHPLNFQPAIKIHFEQEQAYKAITADIHPQQHFLLTDLYAQGQMLDEGAREKLTEKIQQQFNQPFQQKVFTAENLMAAMRQGKVFFRGIAAPSAKIFEVQAHRKTLTEENTAQRELRKLGRLPAIDTRARTPHKRLGKAGNPIRSITQGAGGSVLYCYCGLGMLDLAPQKFHDISTADLDSARGKKKGYLIKNSNNLEMNKAALQDLLRQLKMGGKPRKDGNPYQLHNEQIYDLDLEEVNFIFFSNDPCLYGKIEHNNPNPFHPLSAELQAIFVQQQLQKQYPNKVLPIVEYSGLHYFLRPVNYVNKEDELLEKWKKICADGIKKLAFHFPDDLNSISLEDIKVYSLHGSINKINNLRITLSPADIYFSEEFKQKLNIYIETCRTKEQIIRGINNKIFTVSELLKQWGLPIEEWVPLSPTIRDTLLKNHDVVTELVEKKYCPIANLIRLPKYNLLHLFKEKNLYFQFHEHGISFDKFFSLPDLVQMLFFLQSNDLLALLQKNYITSAKLLQLEPDILVELFDNIKYFLKNRDNSENPLNLWLSLVQNRPESLVLSHYLLRLIDSNHLTWEDFSSLSFAKSQYVLENGRSLYQLSTKCSNIRNLILSEADEAVECIKNLILNDRFFKTQPVFLDDACHIEKSHMRSGGDFFS